MCLLNCFQTEEETSGGYIFEHNTPKIIEIHVSKLISDHVGDEMEMKIGYKGEYTSILCKVIACEKDKGIIYLLPNHYLPHFSHIEIERLL